MAVWVVHRGSCSLAPYLVTLCNDWHYRITNSIGKAAVFEHLNNKVIVRRILVGRRRRTQLLEGQLRWSPWKRRSAWGTVGETWEILLRQCCPRDGESSMVGEIFTGLWMLSSALRGEWGSQCGPAWGMYLHSEPVPALSLLKPHCALTLSLLFRVASVFSNPYFWFL